MPLVSTPPRTTAKRNWRINKEPPVEFESPTSSSPKTRSQQQQKNKKLTMSEQRKASQSIELSQVFDRLKKQQQQQEQQQQKEEDGDDESTMAVKPKSEKSIMSVATESIISMESTTKPVAAAEDNNEEATKVANDKDVEDSRHHDTSGSESKSTPMESPPITPTRLQGFARRGYKVKESPVVAPVEEPAEVSSRRNPCITCSR